MLSNIQMSMTSDCFCRYQIDFHLYDLVLLNCEYFSGSILQWCWLSFCSTRTIYCFSLSNSLLSCSNYCLISDAESIIDSPSKEGYWTRLFSAVTPDISIARVASPSNGSGQGHPMIKVRYLYPLLISLVWGTLFTGLAAFLLFSLYLWSLLVQAWLCQSVILHYCSDLVSLIFSSIKEPYK